MCAKYTVPLTFDASLQTFPVCFIHNADISWWFEGYKLVFIAMDQGVQFLLYILRKLSGN